MNDPRPVDSDGEIYFNRQDQDQSEMHTDDDDVTSVISDGDMSEIDEDVAMQRIEREDVAVNTSHNSQVLDEKSTQITKVLSDIAGVLVIMTKEMQSIKDTMQTRNVPSNRDDYNQNGRCQVQSKDRHSGDEFSCRPTAEPRAEQTGRRVRFRHSSCDRRNERTLNSSSPDHTPYSPDCNGSYDQYQQSTHTFRNQRSGSRHKHDMVNVKIPTFTGKEEWPVWHARFEAIARRFDWSDDDKLDHMLPRMEDQAAQFIFAQLHPRTLSNYRELIAELDSRFRVIETSRSFAAKFSRRSQRTGETAEEYAADLKILYDKAHGYRDRHIREEDLVRRFLDGLRDDDIRFEVEYHKEPDTLDKAVYHVVNMIQTRNNRDRRYRDNTRRAADTDDLEQVTYQTCRVKGSKQVNKPQVPDAQQQNNNSTVQEKVQTDLMLQMLQRLEKLEDSLGSSRSRDHSNTYRRDARDVECYHCHKLGHYARECPEKSSYAGERQNKPQNLNFNGSALVARGRPY